MNIAGTLAERRRADDRGDGHQDDRPDLRLHARRSSRLDRETPQPGRRAGRDQRPRPRRSAHPRGDRDRHRDAVAAWIADELAARDWTLKLIVSTHGHWDHIGDNAARRRRTPAPTSPSTRSTATRLEHPEPLWAPFEIVPSVPAVELAEGGLDPVRRDPAPGAAHARPHRGLGLPARRGRGRPLQRRHAVRGRLGPGRPARRRPGRHGRLARASRPGCEDPIGVFPGHGPATTIGRERAWMELVRDGGRLFA